MSNELVNIDAVKSRMLSVRGQMTLLDRDVAEIYGVQTKEINQAVRNNPDKFPEGFLIQLNSEEFSDWKSKILELLQIVENGGLTTAVFYVCGSVSAWC